MAEIKIEKKKPVWPWVLLVVIVLALVAFFLIGNDEDDDYMEGEATREMGMENEAEEYESDTGIGYEEAAAPGDSSDAMSVYNESIVYPERIGTDSLYTQTALQNLARAVVAIATQNDIESNDLDELVEQSTQMDYSSNIPVSEGDDISQDFKSISDNLVDVLESIQDKNYPGLNDEVADLRVTSDEITAAEIDQQKSTLQAFFRKAHGVLNQMNN